jgi:predicted transposase/invertase (TIGR01784 family)
MKRYLDPKNDIVFKKIFGEHPHLLVSFLNAMMKFEDGSVIVSLEYLKDELVPVNPLKKRSIVDVRCKDNNGRQFIVEMQMEMVSDFLARMLFNTAQIYANQISKGEDFLRLQPVYGLAILNNAFDRKTEEYYHQYEMINPENNDEKIQGISIVIIELPKFIPQTETEKKMTVLWLRFLKEIDEGFHEIPEELTANKEINEAITICEEAAYSEGERAAYYRYWNDVRSDKADKEHYEEIGIKKGREEERNILVRNLAENNLSIEQISKLTKLTIEEITEILSKK